LNFLIDANIPRSTNAAIEALGHDVADVRDILPSASPDSDVALLALKEKRIIITRDLDFANILLYPPRKYPGIIVLKVHAFKPSDINDLLTLFLTSISPETIKHCLVILEPDRFRIKK
jgi:predicted nuclease of predicted toxin-antitoxin system